ncbi:MULTISPECIES: hypothetical protein [Streptomyces]|uniref:Uncharacterized protein n=1 Tax=Streptomyces xanthochromogenes TaxID=67384 RepID=A0ABQ3A0K8_9ACTN|nr:MULTISPECIES: hypothetical protein [Streptomyces]GGY28731.1 hypothetical protein GCM10010326_23050 [Streptomyces xanthochromogenes]GHB42706.1 hypothetical protein GCM10010331_32660 [Streptomyces xanthochromogenes]
MSKFSRFSGPAARAALVAALVSVLGTGYAAHAVDHPAPAPPQLAHAGADSRASLLGALSVGAVVTGTAAVALSRRVSRSRYGK